MLRPLIILFALLLSVTTANSSDSINKYIEQAEVVGAGIFKYLLWEVYDVTLYAPKGKWDQKKPFALTLKYLRDVSGKDIADRSVQEIRKLGYKNEIKLAAWHEQMKHIFPDVREGAALTGIFTPNKPTRFYQGKKRIGTIRDHDFGYWFFNIWLGKQSSEPELRKRLLGQR